MQPIQRPSQGPDKLPAGRPGPGPQDGSQVCAVITTHRPDAGLPRRVELARLQTAMVVLVDDGECEENVKSLRGWFGDLPRVLVRHNPANIGIAASLNAGIAIARARGYRWALLLDDDTLIYPDMLASLIEAWQSVTRQGGKPVAVMGMLRLDQGAQAPDRPAAAGPLAIEKRGVITSGSLISLDVYEAIGGFRDEFFMDSVDYDYCLRARAKGFRVMQVRRVGMAHQLGASRRHRIGPLTFVATHHSPARRYYAVRNSTVLLREHFARDPLYALAVAFFQLKTLALVLLVEGGKRRKLLAMGRGCLDAWRNRLGKRMIDDRVDESLESSSGRLENGT